MPLPEMEHMIEKWIEPLPAGKRRILWCLVCTAVFSLLANGYAWFNLYPVHDAFGFVSGYLGNYHLALGRFLDPVFTYFKGHISVPFLTGLLYTLYLGFCVSIITDVLEQGSRLGIVLTSAFLSVNVSTIEMNAVHQYYSDVFLFALLLSLCGVRMLLAGRRKGIMIAAFAAFFVSFGIYPAFLMSSLCLLILRVFLEALCEDRITRKTILRWPRWFLVLASAGGAFFLMGKLVLLAGGVDASKDRWSVFTLGSHRVAVLINRVKYHEVDFYRLFFTDRFTGPITAFAAALLTVLCVCALCLFCVKKRRKRILIPFVVLLIAFPIGSRLVNIFTGVPNAFRTIYAQFLFFPFLVRLLFLGINNCKEDRRVALSSVLVLLTSALSAIIVAGNILYSNQAFTVQRIRHERALYHAGRVLQDLDEQYPDRSGSEKVAVIGTFQVRGLDDKELDRFGGIGGLHYGTGMTYESVFRRIAGFLGYSLRNASSYADKVRGYDEVKAMPAYPKPGYIAKIGEYIVIKLS